MAVYIGSDKCVPVLGGRCRVAMKALPYDLPLEYLETGIGTSAELPYIDTGFVPNQNTSIEIMFSKTGDLSNFFLFGARPAGSSDREFGCMPYNNGKVDFRFGNRSVQMQYTMALNTTYIIETNKNAFYLKNVQGEVLASGRAVSSTFRSLFPMHLFGSNIADAHSGAPSCRIYSCRISDNATLVRDFIPVSKGQDGYMYDRVSGLLFGNAGGGSFILGNET